MRPLRGPALYAFTELGRKTCISSVSYQLFECDAYQHIIHRRTSPCSLHHAILQVSSRPSSEDSDHAIYPPSLSSFIFLNSHPPPNPKHKPPPISVLSNPPRLKPSPLHYVPALVPLHLRFLHTDARRKLQHLDAPHCQSRKLHSTRPAQRHAWSEAPRRGRPARRNNRTG